MKRFIKHRIATSVALTAPAVRLLVVQAGTDLDPEGNPNPDETWHVVYPVIALQATTGQDYRRRAGDARSELTAATPTGMEGLGWSYQDSYLEYDAIIDTGLEWGICEASFACESVNTAYRFLSAPWPESEDDERLAKLIERLIAEAAGKLRRAREPAQAMP